MVGKVVQLNEHHKWCGCLGIVTESKTGIDRYMIGVPLPQRRTVTAYIFAKKEEFEVIGDAILQIGDR